MDFGRSGGLGIGLRLIGLNRRYRGNRCSTQHWEKKMEEQMEHELESGSFSGLICFGD